MSAYYQPKGRRLWVTGCVELAALTRHAVQRKGMVKNVKVHQETTRPLEAQDPAKVTTRDISLKLLVNKPSVPETTADHIVIREYFLAAIPAKTQFN